MPSTSSITWSRRAHRAQSPPRRVCVHRCTKPCTVSSLQFARYFLISYCLTFCLAFFFTDVLVQDLLVVLPGVKEICLKAFGINSAATGASNKHNKSVALTNQISRTSSRCPVTADFFIPFDWMVRERYQSVLANCICSDLHNLKYICVDLLALFFLTHND